MSVKESTSLANVPSNGHGVVFYRSSLPENRDATPFGAMSQAQPAAAGPSLGTFLHAYRRVGVLATLAGLVLAAAAGALVWLKTPPTFTAVAVLHVSPSDQVVNLSSGPRLNPEVYEAYRGTQQEYVKSDFVITAAIRDPAIAGLPMLRDVEDPVAFLKEKLLVSLPRNTEVMLVSLKGKDGVAVQKTVDAVVDAYIKEAVEYDRAQKIKQREQLSKLCVDKEEEIRRMQNLLRGTQQALGTVALEALTTKQQMLLQAIGDVRRSSYSVQAEKQRLTGELKAQEVILKSVAGDDKAFAHLSQSEMIATLCNDPVYRQLVANLSQVGIEKTLTQQTVRQDIAERYTQESGAMEKAIQSQMQARFKELRDQVNENSKAKAALEIEKIKSQLAALESQEKSLGKEVEELKSQADKLGSSSVELEMLRGELKLANETRDGLTKQRDQVTAELQTASRISVVQRAAIPEVPSHTMRIALAGLAMLLSLALPIGLAMWWDVSTQRVNSSSDVTRDLGLDVFGVVPVIPSRAVRHIASSDHRHNSWRNLVCESVDGIAARLLRVSEYDQTKVVMVSSAVGGEGKTMLATQLAMSLARTGHRTILVDFDLRRPSIDRVFKLPLMPGVSEILRGEVDWQQAVQETVTPNLSVLSAGEWSSKLLSLLAGGLTDALFASLRSEYDYVVVDGCPILPVADARFVSQHADGVILAVLRDVSRTPRVQAACRVLAGLGVRILGAVVAESSTHNGYYDARYQSRRLESSRSEKSETA